MRVGVALLLIGILLTSATSPAPRTAEIVLNSAARSMGRFGPEATLELRGQIEAEELTGEYRETVRIRDGAFISHSHYRLFDERDGYDGTLHWRQDRSGASHALNGTFSRAEGASIAWLKRRGYFELGSAHVLSVTHETISGRSATMLTMIPRGGNPIRLAFDDRSHLLVRAQWNRPLDNITESYSDYRYVGKAQAPFAIDVEESGDHQLIRPAVYVRLASSRRTAFSAPPPPRDTVITGPSTLPLDAPGLAVIPASINERDYNFIVDTGGHDIVTPEIAAELGLTSEGAGTSGGSGPGRDPISDTRVAKLKLGSATMTNQHFTVLDLGGVVKPKNKPRRAGLLGLEVFERMAVTIDEPAGRLMVEPFRPGRQCAGDKVQLLFDDDQPSVHGTIDGIPALIGIDSGNGGSASVLWKWAEAHHVADRFRNGKQDTGHGVGGENTIYLTSHHNIVIGKTPLRDIDVNYATTKTGYFSSSTDSANVGRALLKSHIVRFDYSQGYMCVMPASAPPPKL